MSLEMNKKQEFKSRLSCGERQLAVGLLFNWREIIGSESLLSNDQKAFAVLLE